MTRPSSLFLAACGLLILLGGCGPNVSGLYGNTMYASGLPRLAVTPNPPLAAMTEGVTWGQLQTDTNLSANCQLRYAVYGDPDESGPVLRHGHVLVAKISDDRSWEFSMESFPRRNEVYLSVVKINDIGWTEHLLYENSQGDWFSELWLANGRAVPEVWLAKRWSRTYFGSTRVIIEYREPMPACVETGLAGGYLVNATLNTNSPQCQELLKEFGRRADRAFEIQSTRGLEDPTEPAPAPLLTEKPSVSPDLARLVGKAQVISRSDRVADWP